MKMPIEILKGARELVARPNGWRKNSFGNETSCCSLGALRVAAGAESPEELPPAGAFDEAYLQAKWALQKFVVGSISDWNDAPERTQEQVVETFDKAIIILGGAR